MCSCRGENTTRPSQDRSTTHAYAPAPPNWSPARSTSAPGSQEVVHERASEPIAAEIRVSTVLEKRNETHHRESGERRGAGGSPVPEQELDPCDAGSDEQREEDMRHREESLGERGAVGVFDRERVHRGEYRPRDDEPEGERERDTPSPAMEHDGSHRRERAANDAKGPPRRPHEQPDALERASLLRL